jgi:DNA-binding HxlR family transcriptional regulator
MAPTERRRPDDRRPGAPRQGAAALAALGKPLVHLILELLARGSLAERAVLEELPAGRTTCFAHLRELEAFGAIERRRSGNSGPVSCGLRDPPGTEMLELHRLIAAYQVKAGGDAPPAASVALHTKGLAAGWGTTALRWLGERPRTLSELDRLAPVGTGLADVEAALEALERAGLVSQQGAGRRRRSELTADSVPLARQLAAAVRWHRRHLPDRDLALGRLEAECLLLLAVRDLRIPSIGSERCALIVDGLCGVRVSVEGGGVCGAAVLRGERCDARLQGPVDAWLELLVDGEAGGLCVEGEWQTGEALLAALQASAQA